MSFLFIFLPLHGRVLPLHGRNRKGDRRQEVKGKAPLYVVDEKRLIMIDNDE